MSAKVVLVREHLRPQAQSAGILTMALPFFRSYSGLLIHRVRSGQLHRLGDSHHISIRYWCGNGSFVDGRNAKGKRGGGELLSETSEKAIHCAVCEGKAIGAGCDGLRVINGRHVLYGARI